MFFLYFRYGSETQDVSIQTQFERSDQTTQTDLLSPEPQKERSSFDSSISNGFENKENIEESIEELTSKMLSIQSQTEPVNKGNFISLTVYPENHSVKCSVIVRNNCKKITNFLFSTFRRCYFYDDVFVCMCAHNNI